MKKYSAETIAALIQSAKKSPRKRSHLNIHESEHETIQRLLIALEPDTYITPHFHPESEKKELLTLIQGSCLALTFLPDGSIKDSLILNSSNPIIEFPSLTWHSLICLEPETVVLEVKTGPYIPLEDKHFAEWAPKEGSPNCTSYLRSLKEKILNV